MQVNLRVGRGYRIAAVGLMNRLSRLLLLASLTVGVAACSTTASTATAGATTTFILVRHAEKSTDDARDPSLNGAGRARAVRLARLLTDEPLSAVYATAYQRTQQTAQPVANAHGIVVSTYDAKMADSAFASQLRATHARGTVLVVGHSNTVPGIVAALSGTAVDAIQDDQFDRIYRISIGPNGKATLSQSSY
jgi:broad specificity phosphatase PhoE